MPDQPDTLAGALVRLQGALPHVTKDATNPHFRSRYASLAALSDAIMPVLAECGLAWICRPTLNWADPANLVFTLSYSLRHVSGESIDGQYPLPSGGTPQQIGSAITYARRYALSAVTGLVADDDDDGNQAQDAQPAASVGLSAAEREQRGMMTTQQRREHTEIKNMDRPPRPADRTTGKLADDQWTTPENTEDTPGSVSSTQLGVMAQLFGKLGITDRDERLKSVTSMVGREVESSKDLSFTEAQTVLSWLRKETSDAR